MEATVKMMRGLDTRADHTKEHQRRTQSIFKSWAAAITANTYEGWYGVADEIRDCMDYLKGKDRHFPNWQYHMNSWFILWKTAKCVACKLKHGCDDNCDHSGSLQTLG